MKCLTKETARALIFTSHSPSACIKYLRIETNFYFVLARAFNSDTIEFIFSNIRMRGCSHEPTMTVIIPEEDLQSDLPNSINESIAELRCEGYRLRFGIISALVPMMAGYTG
jgi:hypothetical protein